MYRKYRIIVVPEAKCQASYFTRYPSVCIPGKTGKRAMEVPGNYF